jgi:hypothetical protein
LIISEMQHKLATWAAADQIRRFDRLLRLITDRNWLAEAARIVLASKGAITPGLDGVDKLSIWSVIWIGCEWPCWTALTVQRRSSESTFRRPTAS